MNDYHNEKMGGLVMHIVLEENEHTLWLADKLAEREDGAVTLVDSKYREMQRKGEVTYVNMELARSSFDLPDRLYFYAYMDPEKRGKR